MQVNALLRAICKMYAIWFDIRTVKKQEVVTCMSPEILIGKNCPWLQVDRAKIWNSKVSKLAVLKKYKSTVINCGTKCRNIMSKMLWAKCWNIMLIIQRLIIIILIKLIWILHAETSCPEYRHYVLKMQKWSCTFSQAERNIRTCTRNDHTCSNST